MKGIKKLGLVGVTLAALAGSAKAGFIKIESTSNDSQVSAPDVGLMHKTGGTEGKDSSTLDKSYPYTLYDDKKVIDFFSKTSFVSPYDMLAQETRGPESFTTFNLEILGRNLISSTTGTLKFTISDPYGENIFADKNIFADLYDSSNTLLGTYNVKDYDASRDTIPITVNNGLSYKMDVRFSQTPEPATIGLLAAGAGLLLARRRRGLGTTISGEDYQEARKATREFTRRHSE